MAENEVDKSESLKKSIEMIEELEKSGTLQSLKEMGDLVAGFSKGMTDDIVSRMAGTAEKLAIITDVLSDDNMAGMIKKAQHLSSSLESSLEKIAELEKSGTLQSLKEMGDLVAGFSKGMTDEIVERMMGTAEKLAELTDLTLNYNLKPLLDTGESVVNSGTLADMLELSNGVAAARRMMTDGLMDRAVGTGLDLMEALLTQINIKELLNVIDCSMHKTLTETSDEKYHKGGVLSLVSLAKDPEVMSGLKFMMLLAKNLTRNLRENEQDIFIGSTFRKKECY
ncbi:MAG: helical membrane plugin domain-containing protein [bacterium]